MRILVTGSAGHLGEALIRVLHSSEHQALGYGMTKTAAEDMCQLFHRNTGLPCIVLKTSRFFPEADDDKGKRGAYSVLDKRLADVYEYWTGLR